MICRLVFTFQCTSSDPAAVSCPHGLSHTCHSQEQLDAAAEAEGSAAGVQERVATLERDLAAARKDVKSARGAARQAKAALEEHKKAAKQLQVPPQPCISSARTTRCRSCIAAPRLPCLPCGQLLVGQRYFWYDLALDVQAQVEALEKAQADTSAKAAAAEQDAAEAREAAAAATADAQVGHML